MSSRERFRLARAAVVVAAAALAVVPGGPSAAIVVGVVVGLAVFRRSYIYAVLLALFCLCAAAVCVLVRSGTQADLFAADSFGLLIGAVILGLIGPDWPTASSERRP